MNEISAIESPAIVPETEILGQCPCATFGQSATLGQRGQRRRLPHRRAHELVTFEHDGQWFTGGVGRFPDGCIAEVFLNANKAGSGAEIAAQDAALATSLALQHGCALQTLRKALAGGGPLSALLDLLEV